MDLDDRLASRRLRLRDVVEGNSAESCRIGLWSSQSSSAARPHLNPRCRDAIREQNRRNLIDPIPTVLSQVTARMPRISLRCTNARSLT